MCRFKSFIIFLVFAAILLYGFATDATTRTAVSCSDTDVQSSINSAGNGDTVVVPAGNCTWTSRISISGKALVLQGAGIGQTNITDNVSASDALDVSCTTSNFVRVTGFTIIKGTGNHQEGIVQINGPIGNVCFRFDHNRILQGSTGSRGIQLRQVHGLIDHNVFDVTASGSVQSVSVTGSNDSTDGGFTPWKAPLTLGTNKAVYIEDNTFSYDNQAEDSIDAYGGARLVIRYNNFNNISIGFHGTDSGNRRSVHSYEIYSNTFTNNSDTRLRGATLRGGTGVIYNNTYGGSTSWYGITLMNYRSCPPLDQSSWGTCNGTNYMLASMSFTAQGSRTSCTSGSGCNVKFCSNARDTVCTLDSQCSGGTCTTYFDGAGASGYPCRDQVGVTTNQLSSPLYVWNNGSMGIGTYDGGSGCPIDSIIMLNRDYYAGTAKLGYIAYPYPYPLSTNTPTHTQLNPPTNLRVAP